MKIAGIVIAKNNSNRFPGKNTYLVNRKPLFMHNIDALQESEYRPDVYVATDSHKIKSMCMEAGMALSRIIHRGPNISQDEQPIYQVLKYAHQAMPESYDILVMVLANSLGTQSSDIDRAITLLIKNQLQEVRSYNHAGVENGILVITQTGMEKDEISTYLGAIRTNAKEIHHEKEITGS